MHQLIVGLTLTPLRANSADEKLMTFFLFFPENWILHFMQIVFIVEILHEMSNLCMGKIRKKIF